MQLAIFCNPSAQRSEYSIAILDDFYRFKNEGDRLLHIISLITKFLPQIAHSIDIIHGQKGTAKTTTLRKDKSIVDPDKCLTLGLPKALDALAIMLSNYYFVCFDNIDRFSADVSDMLCTASTGGAFVARKHHTNDESVILEFKRPVSLNGINVVATRPDLLDRGIILKLEPIAKSERRTEAELWAEFDKAKPHILGVIFSILSKALAIYPTVELDELGRMADFTLWGYAVAEAAGLGGDNFLQAYLDNQNRINVEAVDANPVAMLIVMFMKGKNDWNGTPTALFRELTQLADDEKIDTKSIYWPKQPNQFTRRLNEVRANLEVLGYTVESNTSGNRKIRITNTNARD